MGHAGLYLLRPQALLELISLTDLAIAAVASGLRGYIRSQSTVNNSTAMPILDPAPVHSTSLISLAVMLGLTLLVLTALTPIALAQTSNPKSSATPSSTSSNHRSSKPIHTEASWYGPGLQGRKTSTGQTFNSHKLTAASSKLPLGSTAEIKNLQNGRKVRVKINDCGPDRGSHRIDLSGHAADKLKMKHSGVVPVEVR